MKENMIEEWTQPNNWKRHKQVNAMLVQDQLQVYKRESASSDQ